MPTESRCLFCPFKLFKPTYKSYFCSLFQFGTGNLYISWKILLLIFSLLRYLLFAYVAGWLRAKHFNRHSGLPTFTKQGNLYVQSFHFVAVVSIFHRRRTSQASMPPCWNLLNFFLFTINTRPFILQDLIHQAILALDLPLKLSY